ncbi:MAG: acyltransferase [Promethearchaeota archaeon]
MKTKLIKRFLIVLRNKFMELIENIKLSLTIEENLRIIASYDSIPIIKSSKVSLTGQTYLGKNCSFNGIKVVGRGKFIVGDNFHSGNDILVITQIHNYNKGTKIPYDSKRIYKDVIIGDNVWIGSRVTLLGGVRIGEGAIIQAGSVVSMDIPDYAIAGGHPAEPFSYRDIEHYKKLKKEGKFL